MGLRRSREENGDECQCQSSVDLGHHEFRRTSFANTVKRNNDRITERAAIHMQWTRFHRDLRPISAVEMNMHRKQTYPKTNNWQC
jgi:hypothetical protein